jgi:hypothetical protein
MLQVITHGGYIIKFDRYYYETNYGKRHEFIEGEKKPIITISEADLMDIMTVEITTAIGGTFLIEMAADEDQFNLNKAFIANPTINFVVRSASNIYTIEFGTSVNICATKNGEDFTAKFTIV